MTGCVLETRLRRVVFHQRSKFNPSGVPFLIASTDSGYSVKGSMLQPVPDELYRFYGDYKDDQKYGRAFHFDSYEVVIDRSEAGVVQYLSRHINGLGKALASRIVEHFGVDTLEILRNEPDRLAEVSGMTANIRDSVRSHFESCPNDPMAVAKVIDLFRDHKFPRKLADKVVEDFGSDAPQVIVDNPYILLAYRRVGWKGVDTFAMETVGYPKDGIGRQRAAFAESIRILSEDGHTYCSLDDAIFTAHGLIKQRVTEEAIESLADLGQIVVWTADQQRFVALTSLYRAEQTIADRLSLLSTATVEPLDNVNFDGLEKEQADAIRNAEEFPVSLIAGGPGTGKTFTIAHYLSQVIDQTKGSVLVIAPTGKAAKRAEEVLTERLKTDRVKFSTIHRALGFTVGSDEPEGVPASSSKRGRGRVSSGYMFHETNPLPYGRIVIDELSMVDVQLFASLLRAISLGTQVILVGDQDQLPSVGPGSVLRDLMHRIPTTELVAVRRNAGRIVKACHALKNGKVPEPSKDLNPAEGENWVHIECGDLSMVAETIVDLHRSTKTFDPKWGMQVVTPQNGGLPVGCENLNGLLANYINPCRGAENPDDESQRFRIGDKVVRTKNATVDQLIDNGDSYDDIFEEYDDAKTWQCAGKTYKLAPTTIVNGDIGEVKDIVFGSHATYVVVEFKLPNRVVRLSMAEPHLVQAYALTCHKMQGSSAPYVIVPVSSRFYWNTKTGNGLFSREWLYTAMSRAEKILVTVGEYAAVMAASTRRTIHLRRTRLGSLGIRTKLDDIPDPDPESSQILVLPV